MSPVLSSKIAIVLFLAMAPYHSRGVISKAEIRLGVVVWINSYFHVRDVDHEVFGPRAIGLGSRPCVIVDMLDEQPDRVQICQASLAAAALWHSLTI